MWEIFSGHTDFLISNRILAMYNIRTSHLINRLASVLEHSEERTSFVGRRLAVEHVLGMLAGREGVRS